MTRHYWEKLYANEQYVYGKEPNLYLQRQLFRLRPRMRALAIGDGEGRNGAWLAEQRLDVVAVDYSQRAVEKARRLARHKNVTLQVVCCDLLSWEWPQAEFDIVAAIYLHLPEADRKKVHGRIIATLKQGGLLVLEGFDRRHLAGKDAAPEVIDSLFSAEALKEDFRGLKLLEVVEVEVNLNAGCMHQGKGHVVRILAQKG